MTSPELPKTTLINNADRSVLLGTRLYDFLDSRKATDPLLLDLSNVNPYFRAFLIATATSQVHLSSLVRDISREFAAELPKVGPSARPDQADSGWVIVDFIDVVVHLFEKELREFYNLERLWGDGRIVRGAAPSTNRNAESQAPGLPQT